MSKDPVSQVLLEFFERRKKDRRGMSVRTLARLLQLSPSFAHHILKGTRRAPIEVYERLCDLLDIDAEKRDLLLARVLEEKGAVSGKAKAVARSAAPAKARPASLDWKPVPVKAFHLLESRKAIAVLETLGLRGIDGRLEKVASELGLPLDTVARVAKGLREAGMISEEQGRARKTARHFDFSSAKAQDWIRAFHKDCLQAALRELGEKTSEEERERRLVTTLLFAVEKQRVPALKARLQELLDEVAEEFFTEEPDAVYQLGLQAFPVTK